MNYRMFIDDERFPVTPDWYIARNSYQAIYALETWGIPQEIAFDHDLGGDDTAIIFINKLQELLENHEVEFPVDFKYHIHSQNPIGAMNIRNKMDWLLMNYL